MDGIFPSDSEELLLWKGLSQVNNEVSSGRGIAF